MPHVPSDSEAGGAKSLRGLKTLYFVGGGAGPSNQVDGFFNQSPGRSHIAARELRMGAGVGVGEIWGGLVPPQRPPHSRIFTTRRNDFIVLWRSDFVKALFLSKVHMGP